MINALQQQKLINPQLTLDREANKIICIYKYAQLVFYINYVSYILPIIQPESDEGICS